MRMETRHNGFSQAALQAVKLLIDDNAEYLTSSADVKDLIGQYLSKVILNPGTDNETFAYQWAEWVDDGAERKASRGSNTILLTNNFISGLCSKPAYTTHFCQCASHAYRRVCKL